MINIVVTGAEGMLGRHVSARAIATSDASLVRIGRSAFSHPTQLEEAVREADLVIHLAGMNRGPGDEIEATNGALAQFLVQAMESVGSTPHVVFANSTHRVRDTAYGRSKLVAASILGDWAERNGARFSDLVLPNVFGEGGRPHYNSVVATFCRQLAVEEHSVVESDAEIEILHAQRVAEFIVEHHVSGIASNSPIELDGSSISVSQLLSRLQLIDATYRGGVLPSLDDELDLDLFNTYRSYLYPRYYPQQMVKHVDQRGGLVEIVKGGSAGQTFVSTSHPDVTRGNHFHLRKVERFVVLQGSARVSIRNLFSRDVLHFDVTGSDPSMIDIPTLHTHSITNTGQGELLTAFWAHEVFDPDEPDTHPMNVEAT